MKVKILLFSLGLWNVCSISVKSNAFIDSSGNLIKLRGAVELSMAVFRKFQMEAKSQSLKVHMVDGYYWSSLAHNAYVCLLKQR
jgi:hypothetical protein